MRSFVAVLLATGLWACTERAPAELPSDARRHWPHEPTAFRVRADQSWDSLDSGGWWRPWGITGLRPDPHSPLSPPGVLEIVYPQGFKGGSAPGTEVRR